MTDTKPCSPEQGRLRSGSVGSSAAISQAGNIEGLEELEEQLKMRRRGSMCSTNSAGSATKARGSGRRRSVGNRRMRKGPTIQVPAGQLHASVFSPVSVGAALNAAADRDAYAQSLPTPTNPSFPFTPQNVRDLLKAERNQLKGSKSGRGITEAALRAAASAQVAFSPMCSPNLSNFIWADDMSPMGHGPYPSMPPNEKEVQEVMNAFVPDPDSLANSLNFQPNSLMHGDAMAEEPSVGALLNNASHKIANDMNTKHLLQQQHLLMRQQMESHQLQYQQQAAQYAQRIPLPSGHQQQQPQPPQQQQQQQQQPPAPQQPQTQVPQPQQLKKKGKAFASKVATAQDAQSTALPVHETVSSEASPPRSRAPKTPGERKLILAIESYLLDETVNKFNGSMPVVVVQRVVQEQAKEAYEQVVEGQYNRSFHTFISDQSQFRLFHYAQSVIEQEVLEHCTPHEGRLCFSDIYQAELTQRDAKTAAWKRQKWAEVLDEVESILRKEPIQMKPLLAIFKEQENAAKYGCVLPSNHSLRQLLKKHPDRFVVMPDATVKLPEQLTPEEHTEWQTKIRDIEERKARALASQLALAAAKEAKAVSREPSAHGSPSTRHQTWSPGLSVTHSLQSIHSMPVTLNATNELHASPGLCAQRYLSPQADYCRYQPLQQTHSMTSIASQQSASPESHATHGSPSSGTPNFNTLAHFGISNGISMHNFAGGINLQHLHSSMVRDSYEPVNAASMMNVSAPAAFYSPSLQGTPNMQSLEPMQMNRCDPMQFSGQMPVQVQMPRQEAGYAQMQPFAGQQKQHYQPQRQQQPLHQFAHA